MNAVVQRDVTGCGIACVAALSGVTYRQAQSVAHGLGISAEDPRLWSDTAYVRTLLHHYGIRTADKEQPFDAWDTLQDLALLALKWHLNVIALLALGRVLPRTAWGCCTGPKARTPHESTYRLRSHETKVVHRNPASRHGAQENQAYASLDTAGLSSA
jgi:hypothetical protein